MSINGPGTGGTGAGGMGGGAMGGGGGSRSSGGSKKNNGLFGMPSVVGKRIGLLSQEGGLATVKGINDRIKAEGGNKKPLEDNIASTAAINTTAVPLSDVQKAVIEARRQRAALAPGVEVAQTVLGMMPAPGLGMTLGAGNWMGKKAEDDAYAHPERFTTMPGDPGAVRSVRGPLTSNRALSAPSAKSTEASADESTKKKKALPTLLGAPAQALGTFTNPVQIT